MITDWKKVGIKIGVLTHNDVLDKGVSTEDAKKALETILGEEWIQETVNTVITENLGTELALNCLKHLSSERAVNYAYSIYKSDPDLECKRMAVWLIKHLSVKKSYNWIEEFLNDKNVIGWGIGVLDQLLWSEEIYSEDNKERIAYLFQLAIDNSNGA